MILGYWGTREYNQSSTSLEVTEEEGRRSGVINKRCLLVEASSNDRNMEAEELRSNLKSRAEAEGEFVQNMEYPLMETLR